MNYSRFEQLALLVGTAAILGSLALASAGGPLEAAEIVAQLMLVGVLFTAVRYGRRGGLIAAMIASAIYILMRAPLLVSGELPPQALLILIARLAAFGLVGVVGGEACSRMKYLLARLEGNSALDEWSRVFNQTYAFKTLEQARGRFTRYGDPFSVILVSVSESLFTDLRPARQRTLVRGVADHIRADMRMVDEVARLDDGRFVVLLPHTPRDGGLVVLSRLGKGVRSALGAREESVTLTCFGAAEDTVAIDALIDEIAPSEGEGQDAESGEYSSEGASTRNPAADSTSSAR